MSKKLNKCLEIADELDSFLSKYTKRRNDDLDIICTYIAHQLANDMITLEQVERCGTLVAQIACKIQKQERLSFFEEDE